MFQNWGFLLGEIWVLLLIAALLGLFCGWLIWGRNRYSYDASHSSAHNGSNGSASHNGGSGSNGAKVASAGAAATGAAASAHASADNHGAGNGGNGNGAASAANGNGASAASAGAGSRPAAVEPPKDGKGDDLTRIKGIGPKMQDLCHSLGFYYFEQIAQWTPSEVAWVDDNLEGFKGRVTRDHWVDQAKILAAGGQTEFSKRVDKGEVY